MKKRVVCIVLAAAMAAGSLAGCGSKPGSGGSDGGAAGEASGGEEGKVINIYSWNDEFRERVEAVSTSGNSRRVFSTKVKSSSTT